MPKKIQDFEIQPACNTNKASSTFHEENENKTPTTETQTVALVTKNKHGMLFIKPNQPTTLERNEEDEEDEENVASVPVPERGNESKDPAHQDQTECTIDNLLETLQ